MSYAHPYAAHPHPIITLKEKHAPHDPYEILHARPRHQHEEIPEYTVPHHGGDEAGLDEAVLRPEGGVEGYGGEED